MRILKTSILWTQLIWMGLLISCSNSSSSSSQPKSSATATKDEDKKQPLADPEEAEKARQEQLKAEIEQRHCPLYEGEHQELYQTCCSLKDLAKEEQHLLNVLIDSTSGINGNCESLVSNLNSVVSLDLSNKGLVSLKHLSAFKNLRYLNASRNYISSLTGIENLKLVKLNLKQNKISTIHNLQNMTDLKELELGQNEIQDVSVIQKFSKLEKIDLNENKIQNFTALSALQYLKEVYLNLTTPESFADPSTPENAPENSDTSPDSGDETNGEAPLEDEQNPSSDMNLTNENQEQASTAEDLRVKSFGFLVPSANRIETLHIGFHQVQNVSFLLQLPNLKNLDIRGNELKNLEVIVQLQLEALDIRYNRIESYDAWDQLAAPQLQKHPQL